MGVKIREKPEGSGVYWAFIDHNGKRRAKKIGGDKKAALGIAKKIEDGMSISRAKRIKATLSGIFSHAVEDGLIVANPSARLDRFLNAKDQRLSNEISPYTAKELEIYLESESRMERGAGVGFCESGRQTTRSGKFARPSPLQGVRKSETAPGAHPRH